ncbi:serine/threonine protein kinase [Histomonas meleagridis]|uniref:serine/threonine protein kinase n=1 Tax=Histomonas meleagridis TaxID=135588 RepID=UPI0035594493|nr:serine/threonine protein kinase [Histomonas meleagridis]KAH0796782.1 serine/threonine protein kinase [Histomonas meleagridis]
MSQLDALLMELNNTAGATSNKSAPSELGSLLQTLSAPKIESPPPNSLASLVNTPVSISSTSYSAEPVELPQMETIIPDSLAEYRPSPIKLLPTKPSPMIFGFTGFLRHQDPFSKEYNGEKEITVISEESKPTKYDCDPGPIIHPDISRKIQYSEHIFQKFSSTQTYDENINGNLQDFIKSLAPYSVLQIPTGEYDAFKVQNPIHIIGIGKVKIYTNKISEALLSLSPEAIFENIKFVAKEHRYNAATVSNSNVRFINCKFSGGATAALSVEGKSFVEIKDCKFKKGQTACILAQDTVTVNCNDSTLTDSEQFGFIVQGYAKCVITNCTITDNLKAGVCISERSNVTVTGSTISKNKILGIEISSKGDNVFLENNVIKENGKVGVLVISHSKVTLVGNSFVNHERTCLDVKASRVIMNSNKFSNAPENALVCLTEYASAYSDGDSFSGQCRTGVASVGGSLFVGRNDTFSDLSICGVLSYMKGNVQLQKCEFTHIKGPSLQIRENSVLQIRDCKLYKSGPPLLYIGNNVRGSATNCIFTECDAGAIDIGEDITDFIFENCTISNSKYGIKIHGNTSPVFKDCKINGNSFMGIEITSEAKPKFEYCQFNKSEGAGCTVFKNSNPEFLGCSFDNNSKQGLSIQESTSTLTNCRLSENGAIGLVIAESSKVSLDSCLISKNNIGVNVIGLSTKATFNECQIIDQQQSNGMYVIDSSKAKLTKCELRGNNGVHIEARKSGIIKVTDSDLSHSIKGASIIISDSGIVNIKNSNVHDEEKAAIIVNDNGVLNACNTRFNDCGICGICLMPLSTYKIENCTFKSNTSGICVKGGTGSIEECDITDNRKYGIEIDQDADPKISSINYMNNGSGDCYKKSV